MLKSSDSGSLGSSDGGRLEGSRECCDERYQPRTPAMQTSRMMMVLKRIVWRVDWDVGIWRSWSSGFGSGSKGTTGERCVPSRERRRSRNDWLELRRE